MRKRQPAILEDIFPREHICLPLHDFLLIEQCPSTWRGLDIYLMRDDAVTFYVGQSACAFTRIWQHITDGCKGRSTVGHFILCNFPQSLDFTLEMLSSQADQFVAQANQRDRVEAFLIAQHHPCLNDALNAQPTPLPAKYHQPLSRPISFRTPRQLMRAAERRSQSTDKQQWVNWNPDQ